MVNVNKNVFNLSHHVASSFKFGQLIPFLCEEVIPGDMFDIANKTLVRLAPLIAPVMHEIKGKIDYFFVPNRLLWENWEDFITGGDDGKDVSVFPTMTKAIEKGSLFDYFGLTPTVGEGTVTFSALQIRAYNKIWNEWFRDQNLQEKRVVSVADGDDTTTDVSLAYRNYEKDYFTCAFPYAQKGDPVYLPLGTSAPVIGNGKTLGLYDGTNTGALFTSTSDNNAKIDFAGANVDAGTIAGGATANNKLLGLTPNKALSGAFADLSEATSATISDIRTAFQIQKFLFRSLRGGSRYVEHLLEFYGVVSSDARLQRPEYLGGSEFDVTISEVLQTSAGESDVTPTGSMYGHGIAANISTNVHKSFEEHGFIIGLVTILPKTEYMQMMERQWNRTGRYDFYNPVFANLGYQEILNKEIYSNSATPTTLFGFQGRYDELRHRESHVCGDFRDTLAHWHLARDFDSQPLLNESFIKSDQAPTRCFADYTDDYLWVWFQNDIKATRPLPAISNPGMIDHDF